MGKRVLVAYATWAGSTAGVAKVVAEVLAAEDLTVDVRSAGGVADAGAYDAFVLGTGIHAGRPHKEFRRFVRAQRHALAGKPVAFFVVCLTMKEDTEENRCKAADFLKAVREEVPEVEPASVGLFGGAVFAEGEEYEALSLPLRLVMKAMAREQGDYRDWAAIKEWARSLVPLLQGHDDTSRPGSE
jgi:menaquinone-dependent protoporphyrinogen oxidase